MRSLSAKHGFTLIELLVVIAIIAILASILFPVFAKAREKARQTTCLSQIRQIAIAAQMYDQDNNARYPGYAGWDSLLGNYLGNNAQMFTCPSDSSSTGAINSYGYSGMLVRADGSGVNESVINAPTEVGVVCDASPSMAYGSGGLIGGGGLQPLATVGQIPDPRHSGGTVVGYADGHAIYCPNGYNAQDTSNNVTRAFYMVDALGLINSPGGGLKLSHAECGVRWRQLQWHHHHHRRRHGDHADPHRGGRGVESTDERQLLHQRLPGQRRNQWPSDRLPLGLR